MATMNCPGNIEDRYFELVLQFPLRPIRSDEELDNAVRMVDSLLGQPGLSAEEDDYLEVLSDLVERYEADAHPMPPVSDSEILRHLIEAKGIRQGDVAEATGIAESTISEALAGKRSLNRGHIGKLANYFRVSPAVFAF
jgi:HTH-type transcriptional regulator / antitoxin HigA